MCSKADTVAFTNPPFFWDTLYMYWEKKTEKEQNKTKKNQTVLYWNHDIVAIWKRKVS